MLGIFKKLFSDDRDDERDETSPRADEGIQEASLTDEGYDGYKGREPKRSTSVWSDTVSVRTRKRSRLDAPEPCGFDFSDVAVQESVDAVRATGEVFYESVLCFPEAQNREKILADAYRLTALVRGTGCEGRPWNDRIAASIIRFCDVQIDQMDVEKYGANFNLHGWLRVNSLTKSGRVRKFPVTGGIVFESWSWQLDGVDIGRVSFQTEMDYLPNGRVGKAKIVMFANGTGMKCSLAIVSEGLAVTKVELL